MSVAAGSMRWRFEFQRAAETSDALGQPVQAWPPDGGTVLGTRWGRLEERGGRELYFARQVNAQLTGLATCRPFAGLTAKDRIKATGPGGTRVLNISAIRQPDGNAMVIEYAEKV